MDMAVDILAFKQKANMSQRSKVEVVLMCPQVDIPVTKNELCDPKRPP